MGQINPIQTAAKAQLFVDAFFGEANLVACVAAKLAGFGGKKASLEIAGSRMMRRDDVKELIRQRLERVQSTPDEILHTLTNHMRTDIADVFDIDDDTGEPTIDLRRAKAMKRTNRIKKLKYKKKRYEANEELCLAAYVETEVEVELHDAQSAAYKLAQIHGMIIDRKEISRRNKPKPVDDQALITHLTALRVPEADWPPGVLARHRKSVKNTVISTQKGSA